MKILRTPDSAFENLKDYPFEPNYTTIQTNDGTDLRIHHIDEVLPVEQIIKQTMQEFNSVCDSLSNSKFEL